MLVNLLRPLLGWLFWNRRRPLLVLAVALIILVITARLAGCGSQASTSVQAPPAAASPAAAAPAATASSGAPAPAAAPPSSPPAAAQPSPSATGPAPAAAIQAARAFLAAWVSRAAGRDARIRATATAQLAAQETGPAAGLAPATSIDGPLTVTSQGAGAVSLAAGTNAGTALLTVRLDGGRWLAAQVMLSGTGD
jgi:pilus assembly protein FimV